MSTATPRQRSIEDEDESVRIAVRALGDMRSRAIAGSSAGGSHPASSFQPTPALSTVSTSTSPTLASPSLVAEDVPADPDAEELDADFVSRVSHLPLVTTALRAYEQSKASSRVVKYGAEMMESSMKAVSRPVIDRLPVGQLDEFACRQLDRLGRYGGARPAQEEDEQPDHGWESGLQMRDVSMTRADMQEEPGAERGDMVATPAHSPRTQAQRENEQQQQVVQRSRWQAVLLEAGGIGAAVSEESMRRLKYCLQWLQYATAHIDGQIVILRNFMDALQPPPGSSTPINPEAVISPEHLRQLTNAKRDVVDTIRQVVDVVSKYAGSALPEPARSRVRGFILQLPQAWASAARRQGQQDVQNAAAGSAGSTRGRGTRRSARARGGDRVSGELSRPASPANRSRASSVGGGVPPTAGAAAQAAQRILTLATESLDMMRGVTGVVKDSLDRADAWVDRLRVVGLQRQGAGANGHERLPPPVDLMTHRAPMGSTNTSVTSSPVMHSTVLPPLRTPEALSPLVHSSGGESYFPHTPASGSGSGVGLGINTPASAPASSMGFGRLNIGEGGTSAVHASGSVTPVSAAPGKKGMFAEEGEGGTGLVRRAITPRTSDDGGTKMDVDA